MAAILYPTRAGDSTYRNQDLAVAMAQEQGASLILLYVSNVRFLDSMAAPKHLDILEAELDELGDFLLAMAQERAEKSGIKVEAVIRHGGFRQAVIDVAEEHDVVAIILGRPTYDTAVTTLDYISDFAQSLPGETGVEAYVIHDGEIVEHYKP